MYKSISVFPKSAFAVFIVILLTVGVQGQTSSETKSLGEIARENRERRATSPKASSDKSSRFAELAAEMSSNSEDEYTDKARQLLAKSDFDGLERMASLARGGKSRFPGGVWKLYTFYQAVGAPADEMQAAALKRWAKERPQSVTAQVALAQMYLTIGEKARGSGYADTVSEEGWRVEGQSTDQALTVLKQAASLNEKCPYWYAAMMLVATSQGWSKAKTRALVDESIANEPDFYHVYRLYANYLQPKWYGEPGESVQFAKDISQRLGGDEGEFVYFEIATLLGCNTCGDFSNLPLLSWPRIKEGHAALERLYGTSKLKQNRFAFLAFAYHDKEAAGEAFKSIGDEWEPKVWGRQSTFQSAKQWALQ
jgi:hypothetical protein